MSTTPPSRPSASPAPDTPPPDPVLNDPILEDPILAGALGQLAQDTARAPDLSAAILEETARRRRFVKRRRREHVRRVRYALAAGFIALVGGAAILHRLAPEAATLGPLDRPVAAVADAVEADRDRLADVAGGFADAAAIIGGGALGLSPGAIDQRLGLSSLGLTGSGTATASGTDLVFTEFGAVPADFEPGAFDATIRVMLEHPLAASQLRTSRDDLAKLLRPASAQTTDETKLDPPPNVDAPAVIDLSDVLSDPAPAPAPSPASDSDRRP